jgi:hypothetical protein
MTLAKLLSLIQTRSLFLCRLDLLSDIYEGSNPRILVERREKLLSDMGDVLPQVQALAQRRKKATYVNCWNLSDYESETLWRLYGADGDGIAIRASYQSLVDIIESDDQLFVGRVQYIDYETEWFPGGNFFYPIMHKRRAFAHEQEVRFVKLLPEFARQGALDGPPGITVPIDIDKLIQAGISRISTKTSAAAPTSVGTASRSLFTM